MTQLPAAGQLQWQPASTRTVPCLLKLFHVLISPLLLLPLTKRIQVPTSPSNRNRRLLIHSADGSVDRLCRHGQRRREDGVYVCMCSVTDFARSL